jgi:hypothetical protein
VIAFIYADLLILPILNICRKYYGARTADFLDIGITWNHTTWFSIVLLLAASLLVRSQAPAGRPCCG